MSAGRAAYAQDDGIWIIRLRGDVRYTLGPALDALVERMFADPDTRAVSLDLSQAESVDSTCLGILARIATDAGQRLHSKPTLVAKDTALRELLDVMCFDRLFHIVPDAAQTAAALQRVPRARVDERQMLSLVLAAHRRLCDIDQKTRAVFKDVVTALEQDQKRLTER